MKAGAKNIIACDRAGALYRGRTDNMNSMKEWFAKHTNEKRLKGTAADALKGADVFIGLSGPGVVSLKDIKAMNRDPIVFAMANPVPEIQPEEAGPFVPRDGHRPLGTIRTRSTTRAASPGSSAACSTCAPACE